MPDMEELEEGLLLVGEWFKAPQHALRVARELSQRYGGRIGIGRLDSIGFYVLCAQGETPLVVWQERKIA